MSDAQFLARALQLASLGTSLTFPNPKVGAVLVHEGKIIGEGFHAFAGGPHAEVYAIADAERHHAEKIEKATLYVSLEPCSHLNKRTPPCASLILEKKIPRVVIGCQDPNPNVSGNGVQLLREGGVEVILAGDPTPFEAINRAFFVNQREQRTYITLKWAQTPDGYMAGLDAEGQPYPVSITAAPATAEVHRLRAMHHAILVGAATARIDNPSLTTRYFYGESPVRIVLDKSQSLRNISLRLHDTSPKTIWVEENIPAAFLAKYLYQTHGISSVLVEGGREVLDQLLSVRCWDEAFVFTGNTSIGNGLPAPNVGLLQPAVLQHTDQPSLFTHYQNSFFGI